MRLPKLIVLACFLAFSFSLLGGRSTVQSQASITEAPTGFDEQTNGFIPQGDASDPETFLGAKAIFDEVESIEEGLGPLYNAESCRECHRNPVSGASSQVTELRAGHFNGSNFVDHPGGSLINDRALYPEIQERVLAGNEVRALRLSLNILGDGFVECIDTNTLVAIANSQPSNMRGQIIQVPLLEAPGNNRAGRFGWKNQHASLLSFAADAYLNEMGVTSPLMLTENTSNGNSVADYDTVDDPEDPATPTAPFGGNIEAFVRFMRATKAPPRDAALAATPDAVAGSNLFNQIGCAICHVRDIVTAPPGAPVNAGTFNVPAALGNKRIHPFGDFLLHDVGTGDGIVQNGGQSTRNKLRTPPLWGMRTRIRLMHDGLSVTRSDAILRHAGEANSVINRYRGLSDNQKNQLITFLNSL